MELVENDMAPAKQARKKQIAVDLGLRLEAPGGRMIAWMCSGEMNGTMSLAHEEDVSNGKVFCASCRRKHQIYQLHEAFAGYWIGDWGVDVETDIVPMTNDQQLLLGRMEILERAAQRVAAGA